MGEVRHSRAPGSGGEPHLDMTLRRARAFMEANAREAITVDDVARAVHISTRGLQYAFKRATGEAPTTYLRRVRLSGAHADLLRGDDSRVAEIARRWGFASPSRFAVHYRATYGRSPGDVVKMRRAADD